MNIYFENLNPETKNKIIVRTMDDILEEGKRKRPKSNRDWIMLWEEACDRVNRNNLAIDIKY